MHNKEQMMTFVYQVTVLQKYISFFLFKPLKLYFRMISEW